MFFCNLYFKRVGVIKVFVCFCFSERLFVFGKVLGTISCQVVEGQRMVSFIFSVISSDIQQRWQENGRYGGFGVFWFDGLGIFFGEVQFRQGLYFCGVGLGDRCYGGQFGQRVSFLGLRFSFGFVILVKVVFREGCVGRVGGKGRMAVETVLFLYILLDRCGFGIGCRIRVFFRER